MLTNLLRDKNVAPRLVPIIPDEARTFGMEGFFRKIGIYAHEGQKYEPEDSEQLSSYKETKKWSSIRRRDYRSWGYVFLDCCSNCLH